MDVVLPGVAVALIAAGILFALKGRGNEDAGLSFFKVNVSGQSWLVLVAMGVALLGFHWYISKGGQPDEKDPAGEIPPTTLAEAEFTIEAPAEPYTFGDDGEFDALWLQCEAGAMQACDDLYQESPVGSEYELFGATCGARFLDPPEFCVDAPLDASTIEP